MRRSTGGAFWGARRRCARGNDTYTASGDRPCNRMPPSPGRTPRSSHTPSVLTGMYAVDGGISNYVPVRLRLPPLIPKSRLGRKALPWKISRQGSSGGASRQGSAGCPSRQGSAGCASRQGSLGCPSRQGSLTSASRQGSLGCPSRQGSWGRTLKTLRTKSGQQQQPLWRKGSGGVLASPPAKGAHTLLRAKSGVDFELDYTMDGRLDQSR